MNELVDIIIEYFAELYKIDSNKNKGLCLYFQRFFDSNRLIVCTLKRYTKKGHQPLGEFRTFPLDEVIVEKNLLVDEIILPTILKAEDSLPLCLENVFLTQFFKHNLKQNVIIMSYYERVFFAFSDYYWEEISACLHEKKQNGADVSSKLDKMIKSLNK